MSRSQAVGAGQSPRVGIGLPWRGLMLGWLALSLWLPWLAAGAAETVLETADVRVAAGNDIDIRLNFSGPAPQAKAFTTSNPDRLVVDLPGVRNGLKQRNLPIQSGAATSLTAIEASDRTRVVVNLNSALPYEVTTEGSHVLIGIHGGGAGAAPAPVGQRTPREPAPQAAKGRDGGGRGQLREVDFRRGTSGEGRILIRLPSARTSVDVVERGTHLVVDLTSTTVPPKLVRRLDVTDFGTPVVAVETRPKDQNAQIDIQTAGEFEFMSYQAEDLLTVEVRRPSKTAKERARRDKPTYSGDRLSLNFQNIEVRAVLQLLADFTGINIVVSDGVAGSITLRLKNVPWDQALDIILKTKGLSKRESGNVILVAPTAEMAAQERLELASEQQIQDLAPLRSEFVQMNYANAADIAKLLKSQDNRLLSERGAVSVDQRTNTLLVQDTAAKLDEVRGIAQRLDVAVRQVMIESRVVIASNEFARELGVRFGFVREKGTDEDTIRNMGFLVNLPTLTNPSGTADFIIGKVGEYLLRLELTAMQREGKGEIVSNPRVVTGNDQKATIKVGKEIPYQESAASGATTVTFKEAVLELDVTPHITPDDRVQLDLNVKKDNPDWARQVLGVPPIDTRSVKTKVLVDNGETVVLGGVFERETRKGKESVPFFGEIPLLGYLFRRTTQADANSELLIFVTPKILKEQMKAR